MNEKVEVVKKVSHSKGLNDLLHENSSLIQKKTYTEMQGKFCEKDNYDGLDNVKCFHCECYFCENGDCFYRPDCCEKDENCDVPRSECAKLHFENHKFDDFDKEL